MTARVSVVRQGQGPLRERVLEALEWIHWQDAVQPGARVFIKPNLTWHTPMPGVTTSPEVIEALVSILRERTPHITIGESDGGYHAFRAEEAFEKHRLYEMASKYNVQVVSLNRVPAEEVSVAIAGKTVQVLLPTLLVQQTDVFISMPVPKVHAMTRVSLGFKNQWGCIPDTMRLKNHALFDEKIVAINQLLRPRIVLYDGTYFLDKSGPMTGEPVPMGLLIAASDIGAGDFVCSTIMGVSPKSVEHFRVARRAGMMPAALQDIQLNDPLDQYIVRRFRLQRSPLNYVALLGFGHSWLTTLLYDSPIGTFLHKVLYTIRRIPLIRRLLYGRFGPPADQSGDSEQR
ncbi:MAG: DUF362 domain-containing protein [Chloroflexi bacterium]|nr:DUF362 domain-containing protein [Chloroflexota bacterium]